MAGALIKIDEEIVTSAVASVTLTGIDSTYDVYMVRINNVLPATDFVNFRLRFTVSGSADTSSNYDRAFKNLRADTTFGNTSSTNADHINIGGLGTTGQEMSNAILYLFNFNNASEYSFCTLEATTRNDQSHLRGFQGGALLTVAQATDGVNFSMDSGNIASGTFTLYGLKK
jgi:hypothetical protein